MKSKERVLTAFVGQEPGKVPSLHHSRVNAAFAGQWADRPAICEQAVASSVASEILGREAHTGSTELHFRESLSWLDGESAHAEFVDRVYQDVIALHRALDYDIFFLPWRMSARPAKRLDENTLLYGDQTGTDWWIGRYEPDAHTFGKIDEGRQAATFEDAQVEIREYLAKYEKAQNTSIVLDPFLLRAARELGDEFVVAGSGGMAVPMLSGWLECTIMDPGLLGEYLDVLVERNLVLLEAYAHSGIRVINGGGDFAFNDGPVYSVEFFNAVMAPRWKKIFDACRRLNLFYIMRSDGNLWPVADMLFGWAKPQAYYECDYDAGMRFSELRRVFPELVLIGNVSCALLRNGRPPEIAARMIECLDAAAPRVIASSANSILHGTPPENLFALLKAASEFRKG